MSLVEIIKTLSQEVTLLRFPFSLIRREWIETIYSFKWTNLILPENFQCANKHDRVSWYFLEELEAVTEVKYLEKGLPTSALPGHL